MKTIIFIISIFIICLELNAKSYKVRNVEEYNSAVKQAQAGDSIILANQSWKDVKLVLKGEGTKEKPITLTVETPGKCTIEGQSNLRISGNYLIIDGLVFVNGHTPTSAVIEFKTSATQAARYCTLRYCVIDSFNNPDKTRMDNWINLCGQHNNIEYCYFAGKKNLGTTLIVSPNGEGHNMNFHHIYRNHFGPRPKLGSNGGETMRIGTSTYSMENSNTIVEGNYFEHCNGETEIISIKSCENRIIDNTFWECEGSIVLRHGNRNEVSGNYLLGNGKNFTGGIRVINKGHKIYNNYLYGLTGVDFRAPLVIMNGVPNSPINRYHQVKDVDIAFNTFIDCKLPWQLCVGSDSERTDCPQNIRIANNIVYSPEEDELIKTFDKTDGFIFENNVMQSSHGIEKGKGFSDTEIKLRKGLRGVIIPMAETESVNGFDYILTDIDGRTRPKEKSIGAFDLRGSNPTKIFANKTNCGPKFTWRSQTETTKVQPKVYQVTIGTDNLYKAIRKSASGDIIELTEEGEYINTKKMSIEHDIIIRSKAGLKSLPVIKMENAAANTVIMFELNSGAGLYLKNIALDGNEKSVKPTKYAFSTGKDNNLDHYILSIDHCDIYGFNVKEGGCIFKAYKTSFADTISISNSTIRDSFRGFNLADEKDDKGHYNAENIIFINSIFKNIEQWAMDFYRGGNDESTLGGFLTIDHCIFDNVNNKDNQMIIKQTGLVNCSINNSIFYNSPLIKAPIRLNGIHNSMNNCCIYNAGKQSKGSGADINNIIYNNPKFKKKTNYELDEKSPLLKKATDGNNIGLTNN